ncbi:MAG: helix-turn-helix domain-containing protein, partial [Acidobacteriota bacterium]
MPDNRLWIGVVTSIGEKLSRERESRGATIEDMVRRTGIGRSYLQALENNDFAALPGRAF